MIQVEPGVTAPVDAVMMPMETAMSGAGCLSMFNSAGVTSGKRFVRTAKPAAGSSLNVSATCSPIYHTQGVSSITTDKHQIHALWLPCPVCNLSAVLLAGSMLQMIALQGMQQQEASTFALWLCLLDTCSGGSAATAPQSGIILALMESSGSRKAFSVALTCRTHVL